MKIIDVFYTEIHNVYAAKTKKDRFVIKRSSKLITCSFLQSNSCYLIVGI